jgi:hypothetical protein
MGLNIRGFIETGKRENGGGKMRIGLFSAGRNRSERGRFNRAASGQYIRGGKIIELF